MEADPRKATRIRAFAAYGLPGFVLSLMLCRWTSSDGGRLLDHWSRKAS